jgi:hypothetical protein
MKMREQFEKWAATETKMNLAKFSASPQYRHSNTARAWKVWQAAIASGGEET